MLTLVLRQVMRLKFTSTPTSVYLTCSVPCSLDNKQLQQAPAARRRCRRRFTVRTFVQRRFSCEDRLIKLPALRSPCEHRSAELSHNPSHGNHNHAGPASNGDSDTTCCPATHCSPQEVLGRLEHASDLCCFDGNSSVLLR